MDMSRRLFLRRVWAEHVRLQLIAKSQRLQLGDGIVLGPEIHSRTGDTERLGESGNAAKGSHGLLASDLGIWGHGIDAKYTFHCCQVNFA